MCDASSSQPAPCSPPSPISAFGPAFPLGVSLSGLLQSPFGKPCVLDRVWELSEWWQRASDIYGLFAALSPQAGTCLFHMASSLTLSYAGQGAVPSTDPSSRPRSLCMLCLVSYLLPSGTSSNLSLSDHLQPQSPGPQRTFLQFTRRRALHGAAPALPTPTTWPQVPCSLLPCALTTPDMLFLPSWPRSDAHTFSEHLTL